VSKMRMSRGGCLISLALVAGCGGAKTPEPAAAPPSAATEPRAESRAAPSGSAEVDRAVAAIKANDFRSAKAALDKALEKDPKNATATYYLGVVLENTGDKPGAEKKYKDALALSPGLAEAAINLGAIYVEAGKWDDVVAVTRAALGKRPDEPMLHANMALALQNKGDKLGAIAEYEKGATVVGDNAQLRVAYAQLLIEAGNKAKAAGELRGAMAAAGNDRDLLATIGDGLGRAGAFADCVAALDKAIAAGDHPQVRVNRGLCRHSLKDEPGAKSDFEAATKLDPKFAPAHYYLGVSLLAAGNNAAAAKEFDAAAASGKPELAKKAREQAQAARKAPAKK
jgi:Tfp pilus assembly protein PilF